MRVPSLIVLVLLAGCAADARTTDRAAKEAADNAAKLAKALDGLTPGDPQLCIPQTLTRYNTEVIGDTILYKVNRRLIYRNATTGGCERAAYGDTLVSQNSGSQLCKGQIIATVNFTTRYNSGSCALGQFVPYRAK